MFATEQDLADKLQVPVQNTAARLALKAATARIVSETGQTFTYAQDDTVTLPGGRDRILLPGQPVHRVSSVTTRYAGDASWVTQPSGSGYRLDAGELIWAGGGVAPSNPRGVLASPFVWPHELTVIYDHGYLIYPDDVVGCCLQLAAEGMASPDGTTFERIDDYASRRPDPGDLQGEALLKALVKRYGRRIHSLRTR